MDVNPLESGGPEAWGELIEAIGPAALLVVIESRMSHRLRQGQTAEDILQEALMHAWRDRTSFQWRGLKSFRSWVLSIIDNRIRDAADHDGAQKRGGGQAVVTFSALGPSDSSASGSGPAIGPIVSTTPSRIAMHREHAQAMQAALAALPDDLRDVVRLRVFDQLSIDQIAGHLGIGPSAVRHRFRRGAQLYQRRLATELATRSRVNWKDFATSGPANPSSDV